MLLRSAVLAASLLAALPATFAQEAAAPEAPAQPWQVTCVSQPTGPDMTCSMSQSLIMGSTGQRVLAASISRSEGKLVMTLALPHGLSLPDGVSIAVDGAGASQYPILTADQNGSYATVPLSELLLNTMRAGTALDVTVQAIQGGPVALQMSLAGFTLAVGKL